MKLRNTFLLLAMSFFLMTACDDEAPAGESKAGVNPDIVDVTILQLNDVYVISPLEGGKSGGLARVATIYKDLKAKNPNTIAVLAGDFLSPSLIGTLKDENGNKIAGRQMIETFNVMGLDYATYGNHEFDIKDPDVLQERIFLSDFEWIGSNAFRKVSEHSFEPFLQSINGDTLPVADHVLREFANEHGAKATLGITGFVLPFNKRDYVHYTDYTKSFKASLEQMQGKADAVVALSHLSIDQDTTLAREVQGAVLFAGGHDHVNMKHKIGNTVVAKADANAKTVYIHRLKINTKTGETQLISVLKKVDDKIAIDSTTQVVVDKWESKVNTVLTDMEYTPTNVLMNVDTPLVCTEEIIRSEPTNFGKLATNAMEYALPGADLYAINGGSMRLDDNLMGNVTEYDILRTFPYGGGIVMMKLPGKRVKEFLQIGKIKNKGEGGYMQTSNVELKEGGWRLNGKKIYDKKMYKVVLPKFVASGKEANLSFLGKYDFDVKDELKVDKMYIKNDIRNIVIDYIIRKK